MWQALVRRMLRATKAMRTLHAQNKNPDDKPEAKAPDFGTSLKLVSAFVAAGERIIYAIVTDNVCRCSGAPNSSYI